MALMEINQVADDVIRHLLITFQIAKNIKFLSPTLEQQLTIRSPEYEFMDVHSACLLARELKCPAFVGEYRHPIPEALRSNVIRPTGFDDVAECVMGIQLLKGN